MSMLKMDENTLLREAKDINLDKVQQAINQVRLSETESNNGDGVINNTIEKGGKGQMD